MEMCLWSYRKKSLSDGGLKIIILPEGKNAITREEIILFVVFVIIMIVIGYLIERRNKRKNE